MSSTKLENGKCPHINECKQKILKDSFEILCNKNEIDWDQEDCFKYNDCTCEDSHYSDGIMKTPKEWASE